MEIYSTSVVPPQALNYLHINMLLQAVLFCRLHSLPRHLVRQGSERVFSHCSVSILNEFGGPVGHNHLSLLFFTAIALPPWPLLSCEALDTIHSWFFVVHT